jgi:hypothetical protein
MKFRVYEILKITLTCLLSQVAWADGTASDQPIWVTEMPIHEDYYFAVGVGESEQESESRKAADQDAVNNLFQSIYGVHFTSSAQVDSTSSSQSIKVDSRTEMDVEFLDKIEHLSFYSRKTNNNKILAYQLVRIKKTDADQRKKASDDFYKGHKPGHLFVESDPIGASIFIDGVKHGSTPSDTTVVPGKYTIKIVKAGFKDYQKSIVIKRGDKVSIEASLEKTIGSLVITCSNSNAKLYVDGAAISGDGSWSSDVSTGTHKIVVEAVGFSTFRKNISIQSKEKKEISVTLKPLKNDAKVFDPTKLVDMNLPGVEAEARALINLGKWGGLVKYCRENRKNPIFTGNSYYYEGMAFYNLGLYGQALNAVQSSFSYSKTSNQYDLLCLVRASLNDFEKAVSDCDEAIFMNPDNSSYLLTKARVLRMQNDAFGFFDGSIKPRMLDAYRAASKMNPIAKRECKRSYGISVCGN